MEKWLPIKGAEDFEVSTHGRIRSLPREVPRHSKDGGSVYRVSGKLIACPPDPYGYPAVRLVRKGKPGRANKVHRFVAEAFVPNPHGHNVVNHIDGNIKNNHYKNLEWTSKSGNAIHAVVNGMLENNRMNLAVLNWEIVDAIRALHASGMNRVKISKMLGQNYQNVSNVVGNRTWVRPTYPNRPNPESQSPASQPESAS